MSLFAAETIEEVKRLIDLGYDINGVDNSGKSVLHRACEKSNLDIVKVLCEAGANVNKRDSGGYYPIDMAVQVGYVDIVKYLIENYSVKLDNVLYSASATGNIDVLDYLLALNLAKPVLNLNSPNGNPLITACKYGQIDVVDRLLYAGVNTNIVDIYNYTAIEIASISNRLDIVKKLVMFGADYHTYGNKSLIFSCEWSYDDISEFLIDLGCNLNYCLYNRTPLIFACKNDNLKFVKLLLERGADPNFVNDDGKKAIDYCTSDEVKALFIKN